MVALFKVTSGIIVKRKEYDTRRVARTSIL